MLSKQKRQYWTDLRISVRHEAAYQYIRRLEVSMDNPVTAGGETGRIDQILIGLTQINIAYIYSEDITACGESCLSTC